MFSHEKEGVAGRKKKKKEEEERGKGNKLTIKVLCLQGSSRGNFRNFLPASCQGEDENSLRPVHHSKPYVLNRVTQMSVFLFCF